MSVKHLADNPFFVLELTPSCSGMDIERAGQKLLGMLALGLSSAKTYKTPVGKRLRDEDTVRRAMADLRDPAKHEAYAFWVTPEIWRASEVGAAAPSVVAWADAHTRLRTLDEP